MEKRLPAFIICILILSSACLVQAGESRDSDYDAWSAYVKEMSVEYIEEDITAPYRISPVSLGAFALILMIIRSFLYSKVGRSSGYSRRNPQIMGGLQTRDSNASGLPRALKKVQSRTKSVQALILADPLFSPVTACAKASDWLSAVTNAASMNNPASCRSFISDVLFERLTRGEISLPPVARSSINACEITDWFIHGEREYLYVLAAAEGGMEYLCSLIRPQGRKSNGEMPVCPRCRNTVPHDNRPDLCAMCGTALEKGSFNWTLDNIAIAEQPFLPPGR